jgi:hypothetical protein
VSIKNRLFQKEVTLQKTKFAFVSLLSLLVVVAPAASALAQTPNMEVKAENKEKESSSNESEARGGAFDEIEAQGGDLVSDKKLETKEGEGAFGALIGAGVGALVGLGTSIAHGITHGHDAATMARDVSAATFGLAAAGATIGGSISGPA